MKFISKNTNLNIVLRPGLQAQPLSGLLARPAVFVRFRDGLAVVENEEMVQQMLNHPGYNTDFISADEEGTDPYAYLRKDGPVYVQTEMKYGHAVGRVESKTTPNLPPEIKKLIQDQAVELAKQMLPSMVKETIKALSQSPATDLKIEEEKEVVTTVSDNFLDETIIASVEENNGEVLDVEEELMSPPAQAPKKAGRPAKNK